MNFISIQNTNEIDNHFIEIYIQKLPSCVYHAFSEHNVTLAHICARTGNMEATIMSAVYDYGPIMAVIDAGDELFQYNRGPNNWRCGDKTYNHAILITGWTNDHFIIKNSWGTGWGLNGYLYLPRYMNACNIELYMVIPFVKRKPPPRRRN